jgi:DegV family protein with EDD domain
MVKIITDTTAVLPPEIADRFQIPVVPQLIHFGEDTYQEGIDMNIDQFMSRLKSSPELPKTAAPPPDLFCEIFQNHPDPDEPILCIHPSAEVSGTVRSATVAAQDFPALDIRVVDTRLIASPLGTLVQLAAEWAKEGLSADSIQTRLSETQAKCRIYFLVATLDYLARGGRIGGASALLGNALRIKPILTMQDGQVEPCQKERTLKRALKALKKLVEKGYPSSQPGYLTIMHAGVTDQAEELAQDFQDLLGLETIPIHNLPPAIVTHAGPGALAVGFFQA